MPFFYDPVKLFMRFFLTIMVFLLFIFQTKAQNVLYSQFYTAPYYHNPAFTGLEPHLTFGMNYREQWRGVSPIISEHAFGVYPLYAKVNDLDMHIGGFGLNFYSNTAGKNNDFNTIGGNFLSSFKINLSSDRSHQLNMGLQIGFIQRRIKTNNLRWGTQYDPLIGYNERLASQEGGFNESVTIPEVGAGMTYSYISDKNDHGPGAVKRFFLGGSGLHLNKSDISLINDNSEHYPVAYHFTMINTMQLIDHMSITTNVLYALQNANQQINGGAYFTFAFNGSAGKVIPGKFYAGGHYRYESGLIGMVGIGNNYYDMSFSYDHDTTPLQQFSGGRGALELALKIYIHIINDDYSSFSTPRL